MAIGRFWDITIQDGDIFDGVRQTGFDPKEAGAVERGGVAAHLRPLAPEENLNARGRQWASVFGAFHVICVRERS